MKYLNAFIVLFLVNTIAFAQVPDSISGINYQGIAREADGTPIADDLIDIRITILNNSNPNLFEEIHENVGTNQFGLFTLIIGSINTLQYSLWERATKIKTEADFGSGYTEIATVDLAAVPYAFKAKYEGQEIDFNTNSGYLRISNGTNDVNGNPVFIDSTQISVSGGGTNLPSGGSNGQVLSTDGSGNYSWVNDNTNDNDSDPVNEIQDLQLIGDSTIRLSDVSGNTNSEIHVPNDNQNLSLNGTVISIEDGNTIDLANIIPSGGTDDQNLDSAILNNNILTTYIEGGSAASVNLSSFLDNTDAQYIDTLELHTGNILGISLSNDNVAQSTIDLSPLASADNDWAKVGGGTISSLSDSIYTNGNVGIGDATPNYKLDVVSNSFKLLELTTTNPNAVVGVHLNSTGSGGAQFMQNGGTGGFTFYNKSTPTFTPILDLNDNQNVGIAIYNAYPTEKLDVNGKIRMRSGATNGYIPVSDANGVMTWTAPSTLADSGWAKVGGGTISSLSDDIYTMGRVGVGVNNPSAMLDIVNNTNAHIDLTSTTGNAKINLQSNTGNSTINFFESGTSLAEIGWNNSSNYLYLYDGTISLVSKNGNIGIGTSSPYAKLDVKTNSSSTDGLYIGQSNTLPQLVVKAGGNVGIGTSSPSTKLEVNGDITIDDSANPNELHRSSTGNANLVPIAYGFVNADATTVVGTDNFTVTHSSTGKYIINIPGVQYYVATGFTTVITPVKNSNPVIAISNSVSGILNVEIYDLLSGGTAQNNAFNFVVYKK